MEYANYKFTGLLASVNSLRRQSLMLGLSWMDISGALNNPADHMDEIQINYVTDPSVSNTVVSDTLGGAEAMTSTKQNVKIRRDREVTFRVNDTDLYNLDANDGRTHGNAAGRALGRDIDQYAFSTRRRKSRKRCTGCKPVRSWRFRQRWLLRIRGRKEATCGQGC